MRYDGGIEPATIRRIIMATAVHPASSLMRLADVARAVGHKAPTVRQWFHRGHLPEPDFMVWNIAAWEPETIQPFIDQVKRTGSGAPVDTPAETPPLAP